MLIRHLFASFLLKIETYQMVACSLSVVDGLRVAIFLCVVLGFCYIHICVFILGNLMLARRQNIGVGKQ